MRRRAELFDREERERCTGEACPPSRELSENVYCRSQMKGRSVASPLEACTAAFAQKRYITQKLIAKYRREETQNSKSRQPLASTSAGLVANRAVSKEGRRAEERKATAR
jgi:hypothetical protein